MAESQIGLLVPLDTTIPSLPLVKGPNSIGRDSISLPDKRLSRKHLTLTPSADGAYADLVVDGTNPVVVTSGDDRKKILSKEKVRVKHGDVIELIPGRHLYKFVTLLGEKNDCGNDTTKRGDDDSRKRRRVSDDEGKTGDDFSVQQRSLFKKGCNVEAIRHFNVSKDKIPSTFRLLRVQGLPDWANTSSVSIADVIQGDVVIAVLSNYMVDMDWLLSACPKLTQIPHVVVIHGEGDGTLEHMKRKKPGNWVLHKPPLPISYGTHHSKAMILVYPRGVRVIVHTANFIFVDWNNKSQGLWMQDFPWKDKNDPSKGCGFETDLIDYLSILKWPEFNASIPGVGNFNFNSSFFKKFDYRDATVRLIASVPGYHTGSNLKRWGHMKLRTVLQDCIFDTEFKKSPLIYQFSSLGSLDEKWMAELALSMSSGVAEDKTPLGLGKPQIIWPTVEDIRCSLEGYAAGNAVPSPLKNVEKEFLRKYWAKWKASHTGRCRAMPHIKTFTRYNNQKLAWFLLTSSNLSKAAWGALQKNNSQLMIRSYELGVLFLPSSVKQNGGRRFSCVDSDDSKYEESGASTETSKSGKTKLVTLAWEGSMNSTDSSDEVIVLPVPYELPPPPYTSEDIPWSWDRQYHKKDVYGQAWPRQRGRSFSVEVGFFDTVLEIKEKVQKYQGIPVTRQTLVFNGQILEDKHDVAHCVILQNSLIHLIISPDPDKTQVVPNESLSPSPLPVSTPPVLQDDKIHLLIKRSSSSVHGHVEIHSHATVRRLKEKVYELEGGNVSINRLVLLSNGVELLHDQHSLYECEIFDQTEIEVMIKPSPSNSTGSGFNSSGPKKLSIMVLPKCGTKKVSVEMNPFDNVGQLRKELQLLQQNLHFSLPQEGYFFIYKQNVMDDDRSFRWHQVSQATQLKFLTAASLVDRKVNSSIRLFSYGRLD